MLPAYFALIGAGIASLGGLYYLYETIIGKAKPNRVTWLLWGLLPAIIFIAQRTEGVGDLSWVTFATALPPLLVVIASFFNKKAYWKTAPIDYVLMAVALLGLALWFFTSDPNIAILFSVIADFAAGVPTIIKAWRHPKTESWKAYAISSVGFLVSLLSIHDFDFQSTAFVVYLLAMELLLTFLAVRPELRLSRQFSAGRRHRQ